MDASCRVKYNVSSGGRKREEGRERESVKEIERRGKRESNRGLKHSFIESVFKPILNCT